MFTWTHSCTARLSAGVRRRLHALHARPWHHLTSLGVLAVVALAWRAYADVPAERPVPVPEVAAQCAACHEDQVDSWVKTVHRRTAGASHLAADRQGCGGCHSGTAAHLEDPSAHPPYMKDMSGDQASAICLSCHQGGQQMLWHTGSHAKLQKGCLTCHDPHNGEGRTMLARPESELCNQCHPQQVAEGRLPSHHPIAEGKMTCTDCHNVHGDQRNLLPAESNSEMCYRCHAEKAGPFMGEHPPVTEDCTVCHKPHGSQNDRLLRVDEPMLCLQCHAGHHDAHRSPLVAAAGGAAGQAEGIRGVEALYNRCTSCHSRIHGTDLPSGTNYPTFMPGSPPAADLPLGTARGVNSGPFWGASALTALALSGGDTGWGFSDLELGSIDPSGNPTYVREYDGKNYEFPRVKLGLDQYAAKSDFHLRVLDPAAGDETAEAYFGGPTVSANIKYSALTHREPRFNDVGDVNSPVNIGGQRGAPQPVSFSDLTNGKDDFAIERKVTDIKLAARCPKLRSVKWLASYWRESETGDQQFLFLDRCGACHKVQTTEPINRVTTLATGGAEVGLGKGAVRYLHTEGQFENRVPQGYYNFAGLSSVYNGTAPLFSVSDTRTRIDEVTATAAPSDALALNGQWRKRERANLYNGTTLNIDSTGGGASWRLTPDLRLVASFYSSDFDNGAQALNDESLSRKRDTTRAELRYGGLPWTTLSAGFKREDVDRTTVHEAVPANSKTDTWSASARTNLPSGLSVNVRYRKATTDLGPNFDPASPPDIAYPSRWIAPPTDDKMLSAVATYSLTPELMGSLMYSKLDRSFTVSEPLLGVLRDSGDESKTTGGELFYTAGRRTKLTGGYYQQQGDVTSDVTYGVDDFTLLPPEGPGTEEGIVFPLIDSLATFSYDAKLWRLNASHWLTPRLRLFGRYDRTRSDGRIIANNLGDYIDQDPDLDGLALTLNPFGITVRDQWIGVGYLVDPYTELALSFQKREWENGNDATQDGSYDLWRLGVRKQF